ncbi:unnamed protein product [Allacma fusca]|uniref:EGF-like domain-containing protein n=1 Tax=Allacma fusca TaxID=39272 RepID=A0A8J2PEE4_9HEXA|nr:unnamed protein product [Allacma fusca]
MWTQKAVLSIFVLASVVVLFNPEIVTAIEPGDSYGDFCNTTNLCSLNYFLECKETSRCGCVPGMHLDPNRNPPTCVSKVNQTCSEYPENGLPAKYCTPNSLCLPDASNESRCYCQRNFVEDANGACTQSSLHGEACDIDKQCKQDAFLKCGLEERHCICDIDEVNQVWDQQSKKCVSLLRSDCTPLSPGLPRVCIDGSKSSCVGNICACESSYVPSDDNKRCVRPYNGTCTSSTDCADGLDCNLPPEPTTTSTTTPTPASNPPPVNEPTAESGTCGCSSTEKYNDGLKRCEVLASKACSAESTKKCIENSQCVDGLCKCDDKYILNADGTCAGNFGANCTKTPADTCSTTNFLQCNNESTCECKANYEHSSATGKCIAFIGSPCIDNGNCDSFTSTCNNSRICTCTSRFFDPETPGVRCLGGYEAPCDTAHCDESRFLSCTTEHICVCLNSSDQMFDDISGKCVAYADAQCKLSDGREMGCVANATCNNPTENGLCTCDENFHTEERLCRENSANALNSFWLPIIFVASLVIKM